MENQIQIFKNPIFGEVRTMCDEQGEPWFCGKDVAEALGYAKPHEALKRHVHEDDSVKRGVIDGIGRTQPTIFINEPGLYALIMSSKLPDAEVFRRWVYTEVLPSIRKHGAYMTDKVLEDALLNPDFLINLATSLKEERAARLALQAKNAEQQALIIKQDIQIQEMAEKSSYCEMVLASSELVEITIIAQDYGTTAVTMNKFLHEAGIQYRQGGTWVLYEKYKHLGYTQSKTFPIKRCDGTIATRETTMWTQEGRLFLYNFLKEKYGALPIVERDENYVQPYGLMSSSAKKIARRNV